MMRAAWLGLVLPFALLGCPPKKASSDAGDSDAAPVATATASATASTPEVVEDAGHEHKDAYCIKPKVQLWGSTQNYCGKLCQTDDDCTDGEECGGKGQSVVNGKAGPLVKYCTPMKKDAGVTAVDAGATKDAGATVDAGTTPTPDAGKIDIRPLALPAVNKQCLPGYKTGLNDPLCHLICPPDCPTGAKCFNGICTAK